jgi:hypothetical protein
MNAAAKILSMNTVRADRVRSEWKTVTPEMATKWLEGNTHNRKVRDSVVTRYAIDMKAGRWRQTHQGIAFDEEGTLIDGQHRLYAILEAETSVVLQVTFGLPLESQKVVDDGLARSVVDVMRVANEAMNGMTNLHAAVGKRMFEGMNQRNEVRLVTRQERGEFLKKHWEAIAFVVGLFPVSKRVQGVMSAGPLAAMARAYYHENRADLQRFASVLIDGMSADEKDFPTIKLRNWLMTRGTRAGGQAAVESYAKTQRAIRAFTRGEKVGRNLLPVTEDIYPLPSGRAGK